MNAYKQILLAIKTLTSYKIAHLHRGKAFVSIDSVMELRVSVFFVAIGFALIASVTSAPFIEVE